MSWIILGALVSYWLFCLWFTTRGVLKYISACRACDRIVATKEQAPYGIPWNAFQLPSLSERVGDFILIARAIMVAPIRFGLYSASMLGLCLVVAVCPLPFIKPVVTGMSRLILYILGLSVEIRGLPATGSVAPVVVCNHVGMIDVMILVAIEHVSFLSDIGIGNFYMVGGIWSFVAAKIGCIFVSRNDDSSRAAVKALIRERINLIRTNAIEGRLVLFPEGTTSNGKGIVGFKNGAFENLAPVQPVILLYENKQWGYCSVWSDVYFAYIMALPPSKVILHYIDPVLPCEGESVQDFSDRVRRIMISDSGLYDWKDNVNPTRSHNHITNILTQFM